ncbi:nucleotide sugar dehydrogenase [Petroclostridium sp. X23]|uniref:nucleotide sugar dehydrogenase n=1 Tax=Petroclostridium sp. X23 TaxID=3045146 RepID=UPI0024ACD9CA|nr:nucleotide sugar dehydrogenase [Petroclostridium sp. X23]WHH58344.1 nucleotide sugar dehydrogenase [Petroclostridium sp. X23]
MEINELIINKTAKVGVIGIGYVGLPLIIRIAECGFHVTGIDFDKEKTEKIKAGKSYIEYIDDSRIKTLVQQKKLAVQEDYNHLYEFDVIIICVPTPITNNKQPDLNYVDMAVNGIAEHLRKNQVIILESTTFPGTVEEYILPLLESKGLHVGKDFFLGFSPERVDPGNHKYDVGNTPKIVSGMTEACLGHIFSFYRQFIKQLIKVSSPKTAEMAKILENTFRYVNIALANQFAILCNRMGINVWEVIDAASTKPFGFMGFYPGPGVGGHCIPVDPLYLIWKANEFDYMMTLVQLSDDINSNMPHIIVQRVADILNMKGKAISKSKVLLLGMSYKKDIGDLRESPSLKIMDLLLKKKCEVLYNDPYIDSVEVESNKYYSRELDKELLNGYDCVVILTDHSIYDYEWIVENCSTLFDTRNILKELKKINKNDDGIFVL